MRLTFLIAAVAALPSFALAQGGRPATSSPPAAAQPQPPAVPSLFPCRKNEEICFVAVALPNNQISVLYSNHDKADDASERALSVTGANGAALDLAPHVGRVVMLTGDYDGKTALTNAEIIDTASPLLSFTIKALLAGDDAGQDDPEPVAPAKPQTQQRAPAQGAQQPPRR